jgi:dihydropteroate synthase
MEYILITFGMFLALVGLGLLALRQYTRYVQELMAQCLGSIERIAKDTAETLKSTNIQEKAQADIMRTAALGQLTELQHELSKASDVIRAVPEAQSEAERRAQAAGLSDGSLIIKDRTGRERRLVPM